MKPHLLAAACIASLSSAPLWAADLIDATAPAKILEIAKGFGSAELQKDKENDPFIVGRTNGTKYGIAFYGCKEGKDCDDIQFNASWGKTDIPLTAINQWNKTKRFGVASIGNDGQPMLQLAVNIDYGVSKENLEDTFTWWGKIVKEFQEEVVK